MVFLEENDLVIRPMAAEDAGAFHEAFRRQGWNKPAEQFQEYNRQQQEGLRQVIVAEISGEAAGYVTLLPEPTCGPYASEGIPVISDFNVLIHHRRQGVGSKLMDVAERLASERAACVILAVGLHSGYGCAQRMYVKRGYVPDGSGVWYRDRQLEQYAPCCNDDDLVLYLYKKLC